jgi:hypothetical protein
MTREKLGVSLCDDDRVMVARRVLNSGDFMLQESCGCGLRWWGESLETLQRL